MTCLCPTCNRPMEAARAPIEGLASASLGPIERRIVEILVRAYPRSISADRMADMVYSDDRSGGPDNPGISISVTMIRLREKLPPFGWTIPRARRGRGSEGYHLEPIA